MTIQEQKHKAFEKDLKELLKKHKAELDVVEFGARGHMPGLFELVVDFDFDEQQFEKDGNGLTDQLRLGTWVGNLD
jgi:hypothetical protein